MPTKAKLGEHDASVRDVLLEYADTPKTQVAELIEAIKIAAEAEFLGAMGSSEPQPTAMGDLRALRLRRICEAKGRALTALEVAAVFRISSQQASRLIDRMDATYPLAVNRFRKRAVFDAAQKVVLPLTTQTGKSAGLKVEFKHRHGPLAAAKLLERAGQRSQVSIPEDAFRVDIPISDSDPNAAYDILRVTLGLEELLDKALESAEKADKEKRKKWWWPKPSQ